ncbi:MAG: hypothetical protein L3K15_09640, partial [Thermoplasmata archaeon]|nr:hypothetical protein [Thermoplasmata archaeon]
LARDPDDADAIRAVRLELQEQDRLAEAILRANEAVGSGPDEQVEFLRQALLDKTVESVLA